VVEARRRFDLDLRVIKAQSRLVFVMEACFQCPTDRVDVLLRNKRSPCLWRWLKRDALPELFELTHQAVG